MRFIKFFRYLVVPVLALNACTDNAQEATPASTQEQIHESSEPLRIDPRIAESLGIETAIAGPRTLTQSLTAYGQVRVNTERVSHITARFEGRIDAVYASIGDQVSTGQRLATVESNQSLTSYAIEAPIDGIVLTRNANPGEPSNGRELFTIMDTSTVWVDLALFPADRQYVDVGASVQLATAFTSIARSGRIERFLPVMEVNQAITARVSMPNLDGALVPGSWVEATIAAGTFDVSVAVPREALQSDGPVKVVFEYDSNGYHPREVRLGRETAQWVEITHGLQPGARYVSRNSFILKAEAEKAGAAHSH